MIRAIFLRTAFICWRFLSSLLAILKRKPRTDSESSGSSFFKSASDFLRISDIFIPSNKNLTYQNLASSVRSLMNNGCLLKYIAYECVEFWNSEPMSSFVTGHISGLQTWTLLVIYGTRASWLLW